MKTSAILLLVLLAGAGCSTCKPECCSECPPRIELVESPPEIVTVLPPEVVVPPVPELDSMIHVKLAAEDPAAWLRVVAHDLVELYDSLMAARASLIAVNASRVDPE